MRQIAGGCILKFVMECSCMPASKEELNTSTSECKGVAIPAQSVLSFSAHRPVHESRTLEQYAALGRLKPAI